MIIKFQHCYSSVGFVTSREWIWIICDWLQPDHLQKKSIIMMIFNRSDYDFQNLSVMMFNRSDYDFQNLSVTIIISRLIEIHFIVDLMDWLILQNYSVIFIVNTPCAFWAPSNWYHVLGTTNKLFDESPPLHRNKHIHVYVTMNSLNTHLNA